MKAAEIKPAQDLMDAAKFKIATAGANDLAKAVDEVSNKYRILIVEATKAGKLDVAAKLKEALPFEIDAINVAASDAFTKSINDRIRDLKDEAAAVGMSGAELARYNTIVELTNEALKNGEEFLKEHSDEIDRAGDAAYDSAKKVLEYAHALEMTSRAHSTLDQTIQGLKSKIPALTQELKFDALQKQVLEASSAIQQMSKDIPHWLRTDAVKRLNAELQETARLARLVAEGREIQGPGAGPAGWFQQGRTNEAALNFRITNSAASDLAKTIGEVNLKYDEMIEKAKEAKSWAEVAFLEEQRTLELRAVKVEAYTDFSKDVKDRIRDFAQETAALGLSTAALARYNAEIALTNMYTDKFGQLTPQMIAQIKAVGDAAANAAVAAEKFKDQLKLLDDVRGATRGFFSDLIHGFKDGKSAVEAFGDALQRLSDRILDMSLNILFDALFGKQGTTGTGLLGSLFGSLNPGTTQNQSGGLFGSLFSGLFSSNPTTTPTTTTITGPVSITGGLFGGNTNLGSGTLANIFSGLGINRNNPGNIMFGPFAQGQGGTLGAGGVFAQFQNLGQGFNAMQSLLTSYSNRGLNTVQSILNRWAPPATNPGFNNYVGYVSGQMGVGANTPLNLTGDPAQMQSMMKAMTEFEHGITGMTSSVNSATSSLSNTTPTVELFKGELEDSNNSLSNFSSALSSATGGGTGGFGSFLGSGSFLSGFGGSFPGTSGAGFGGATSWFSDYGFMAAEGGPVRGPGGPKDDLIPAWLSNGEYVLTAEETQNWLPFLESMRGMRSLRRFAGGGFSNMIKLPSGFTLPSGPTHSQMYYERYGEDSGTGRKDSSNNFTINVTVTQPTNEQQARRSGKVIARQIGISLQRVQFDLPRGGGFG